MGDSDDLISRQNHSGSPGVVTGEEDDDLVSKHQRDLLQERDGVQQTKLFSEAVIVRGQWLDGC